MGIANLTLYVTANVVSNYESTPLCSNQPLLYFSTAGTTLYGVNRVGTCPSSNAPASAGYINAAAQASGSVRLTQTLKNNQVFLVPSTYTAPQNTTGGALSAANQLRVTCLIRASTKVTPLRARGDQVAPAAGFIVAAGGGTAAADAALIVKGTTAGYLVVGSKNISLASTGADTNTILVGDTVQDTTNGDATLYYATATTTTLNGTTEVQFPITPPLQVAQVASDVLSCVAASGYAIIIGTTNLPAVGTVVEIDVHAAADVQTVTGGALTAGREYTDVGYDYWYSAGNVSISLSGL